MAAGASSAEHTCRQCGEPAQPAIPLGPDEGSIETYCLMCIADRVELVTGWRQRKIWHQYIIARQYAERMQRDLDATPY